MYHYHVIPAKKMPYTYLTYSYEKVLKKGQIVRIQVRNQVINGLIIGQIDKSRGEMPNIKEISEVLPLCFEEEHIQYLFSFAHNTFNSINIALESFLQPYNLLTKSDIKQITDSVHNDTTLHKNESKSSLVEFLLDSDPLLRIIYLIRSIIYGITSIPNISNKSVELLILVSEKKVLELFLTNISKYMSDFDSHVDIELYSYSGDKSKSSKTLIRTMLKDNEYESQDKVKLRIIIATRSGLFLPLTSLTHIFLIDEASSMHIQEQNSLYFDTRDVVFLLSKVKNVNLTFLSSFPSVRLYSFYSQELLNKYMTEYISKYQKPLKIKITHRYSKTDQFSLISDSVLDIIKGDDVRNTVFEGDVVPDEESNI